MIPLNRISRAAAQKLAAIERRTRANYSLRGLSGCTVRCFITGETDEYYFVVLESGTRASGYDFAQTKFRLMKSDLSVIWSEQWL